MMAKQKLYMCVTDDKYELPLCVSPEIGEIAQFCGLKTQSAYTILSKRIPTRIGTQRARLIRITA